MKEQTGLKSEIRSTRWKRIRARGKASLPFLTGILTALVMLFFYNLLVIKPNQLTSRDINDVVAQALASATPPPAYSALVYQVIQPSLILVESEDSGDGEKGSFGLGSGVVVDNFGDILTSLHVVNHATSIHVTFADGTRSTAQIVTTQPENDIAVLQADDPPLSLIPAVLGNPNAMRVGDEAYVVGNPFGLYSSMSSGVISGFNRTFRPTEHSVELEGLIQIDAAVNPGNSGGPLLNRAGHVVGIVTGIVNPTEQSFFIGIGFAVPIDVAVGGMGSPPY
jgi:S1-C subfamily serine protease